MEWLGSSLNPQGEAMRLMAVAVGEEAVATEDPGDPAFSEV